MTDQHQDFTNPESRDLWSFRSQPNSEECQGSSLVVRTDYKRWLSMVSCSWHFLSYGGLFSLNIDQMFSSVYVLIQVGFEPVTF